MKKHLWLLALLGGGVGIIASCSPSHWQPVHLANLRVRVKSPPTVTRCQRPVTVTLKPVGIAHTYLAQGHHPMRVQGVRLFVTRDLARAMTQIFGPPSSVGGAQKTPRLTVKVRIQELYTQYTPVGPAAAFGLNQYVAGIRWSARLTWAGSRSETIHYSAATRGDVKAISLSSAADIVRSALAVAIRNFSRWLRSTRTYNRICSQPRASQSTR